jgi:hypothetical protein
MRQCEQTLLRWQRRLAGAASSALFQRLPHLAVGALEVEASRFRPSGIPRLFAEDLFQIAPALNDDLLELYGRSEQALANRFGFFGRTEQFGSEIDWESTSSTAWRAELHSFDHALDLALTYRISGDARYARHLRYLIAHWISSNPPNGGSGWKVLPLARRVRNWILSADLAREAWFQDSAFLEIFARSLAQQVTYLVWGLGALDGGRLMLRCSRALLLASRYFGGEASIGLEKLSSSLLAGVLGSHRARQEPQPNAEYELSETLAERLISNKNAHPSRIEGLRSHLRSSLEALEGMLLPDGTLPLFGPDPPPSPEALSDLFALGAVLTGVPRWKSLAGEFGIVPYILLGESGKRQFEMLPAEPWRADSRLGGSQGIYRLTDGDSSALLVNGRDGLTCGSPHDLYSYELVMHGHRTVVDSGAYAPPGEGADNYFASARAHNVLLVGGKLHYAESDGASPPPRANADRDAEGFWLGRRRLTTPSVSHQRGFFLIAGRYWVVLDRLEGKGSHRLQNLVHFYPPFVLNAQRDRVHARSGAASVTVFPLTISNMELSVALSEDGNSAGWYSPVPGVKYPSAVLVIEWPEAKLPWVGGYIFAPGVHRDLNACLLAVSEDGVDVGLGDEHYRLPFSNGQ